MRKTTRRKTSTTKHVPGPNSRTERLLRLDGRTRQDKFRRDIEARLVAHCGGNPSETESIIIALASVKALRVQMLSEQLHDGKEPKGDEHHILSWANSLRLDCQALGLRPRTKEIVDPLNDHFSRPAFREAAE